nr:hypothetical protein [Tanacetum cinerariifolium]
PQHVVGCALHQRRDHGNGSSGQAAGHIPGVGRVLVGQGRNVLTIPEPRCTHTADVDEVKKNKQVAKKEINMLMKAVRSDDKMSQLLTQLKSHHGVGSGSGSGGGGDDEPGEDEDVDPYINIC